MKLYKKENIIISMFVLQIIYVCNIIDSINSYKVMNVNVCRADCLVANNDIFILMELIMPVIAILMIHELKIIQKPQYIVKYNSINKVFGMKISVALKLSVIFTIYQYVSSYAWSMLVSSHNINWNDAGGAISVLYYRTVNLTFCSFSVIYILSLFINVMIYLMLILILQEFNKGLSGIIIGIAMAVIDYKLGCKFILCEVAVKHNYFANMDMLKHQIIAGCIGIAVSLLTDYILTKKKEYRR